MPPGVNGAISNRALNASNGEFRSFNNNYSYAFQFESAVKRISASKSLDSTVVISTQDIVEGDHISTSASFDHRGKIRSLFTSQKTYEYTTKTFIESCIRIKGLSNISYRDMKVENMFRRNAESFFSDVLVEHKPLTVRKIKAFLESDFYTTDHRRIAIEVNQASISKELNISEKSDSEAVNTIKAALDKLVNNEERNDDGNFSRNASIISACSALENDTNLSVSFQGMLDAIKIAERNGNWSPSKTTRIIDQLNNIFYPEHYLSEEDVKNKLNTLITATIDKVKEKSGFNETKMLIKDFDFFMNNEERQKELLIAEENKNAFSSSLTENEYKTLLKQLSGVSGSANDLAVNDSPSLITKDQILESLNVNEDSKKFANDILNGKSANEIKIDYYRNAVTEQGERINRERASKGKAPLSTPENIKEKVEVFKKALEEGGKIDEKFKDVFNTIDKLSSEYKDKALLAKLNQESDALKKIASENENKTIVDMANIALSKNAEMTAKLKKSNASLKAQEELYEQARIEEEIRAEINADWEKSLPKRAYNAAVNATTATVDVIKTTADAVKTVAGVIGETVKNVVVGGALLFSRKFYGRKPEDSRFHDPEYMRIQSKIYNNKRLTQREIEYKRNSEEQYERDMKNYNGYE